MIKEEDYLTYLDKRVRDWLFWPITRVLGFIPYSANILTIIGFLTLIWAVIDFLYLKNNVEKQIWFLIVAWITDMLDGPTARNNNNITAFGTFADHFRDFFIVLWMIFLSFYLTNSFVARNVFSWLGGYALFVMYSIFVVIALGVLLMIIEARMNIIKKRKERPKQPYYEFIGEFFISDLKTTFNARARIFTVAAGIIFYLAGSIWDNSLYIQIGSGFLLFHLIFLGFYVKDFFKRKKFVQYS